MHAHPSTGSDTCAPGGVGLGVAGVGSCSTTACGSIGGAVDPDALGKLETPEDAMRISARLTIAAATGELAAQPLPPLRTSLDAAERGVARPIRTTRRIVQETPARGEQHLRRHAARRTVCLHAGAAAWLLRLQLVARRHRRLGHGVRPFPMADPPHAGRLGKP